MIVLLIFYHQVYIKVKDHLSVEVHMKNLILFNSEPISFLGSRKCKPTFLRIRFVWTSLPIESAREVSHRSSVQITPVNQGQVIKSKGRPKLAIAVDESVFSLRYHFESFVKLKQESSFFHVVNEVILHLVPFVMRISCNSFSELSTSDDQGVIYSIAFSVKSFSAKVMF